VRSLIAIVALLTAFAAASSAQENTTLLHGCETLDGVKVTTAADNPETLLVIARAAEYVTEGAGSIRISSRSPEDATGNSYVSFDLQIEPTDFTNRTLIFDAGTTMPETSGALYVRGYDEYGSCVLSWQNWAHPLEEGMKRFEAVPEQSGQLKWEPQEIENDDHSAVVRLRFYTGTHEAGTEFAMYVDNIRISGSGNVGDEVLLNSCESTQGMSIDLGEDWADASLEAVDDPDHVTEGAAAIHLSGTTPEDAEGNSYLCVGMQIPATDFTDNTTLKFDAATSTPDVSEALYVRGYNAEDECVLSWTSWSGQLGPEMTTFELYPGMSYRGISWETSRLEGDEPVGVTYLRFYVGAHDPATPIDMYIDNVRTGQSTLKSFSEVTEPKRLYPETTLVDDGEAAAIIVTPADDAWREVAAEVASAIEEATGATLQIVDADEVGDEDLAETNAIMLGSIVNNRALLYPYSHQQCFADGVYPGDGGYELRTVSDPWGTGRNLICIGASDIEGARAGLRALRAHIQPGETLTLPSLLEVELTGEAEKAWGNRFTMDLDEEWFESTRADCESHLERAGTRGLFAMAQNQGLNYALTGRDEYAQMYVWMIKRTYEWYLSDPDTYGGPWGMDSDFHIAPNFMAWDAVEESPAISDEERLEVTKILFRWVSELGPQKSASASSTHVRFNHQTFPALGCLYAGQYFSRYYDAVEGEEWIRVADGTFQFQLDASKPHCDCNTYQWLTLGHTMMYSLARPDLRYFENGNARKNAEYAILTMNNLGYQVPYGDVGGWGYIGRELSILRMAEWWYRDGRYQWAIEKKMQTRPQLALSQYSLGSNAKTTLPSDLLETVGYGLDEMWYESFSGSEHVEQSHAFDKITWRNSFDEDAAYLLLDGLTLGGHGHMDGNCLLQWTENGRIWLADTDYIKSLPKYHNGMLVLRDGQSESVPAYAELENLADMQGMGASQTVMRAYAGVDWHRNVMWLKDRMFVVADRMVATEPGDYSFRAVWQTIGDTELVGSTLRVEQDGQHAAFVMTPDTHCIVNEDEYTGKNWSSYPWADEPVVKSMQGIVNATLQPGEQVVLFTVLHASGEEPSALEVTRLNDSSIAITGEGDPVIVSVRDADGRLTLPGAASALGEMAVMTPERMWGVGVTEVTALGETRTIEQGADVEADLGMGTVLVHTPVVSSIGTEQQTETVELGNTAGREEIAEMMRSVIAAAPPVTPPAAAGAEAEPMAELWSYLERPDSFLLTGNPGRPESVEAVVEMSADPAPLPVNVFSQRAGGNQLANAFDGSVEGTESAVMWDDDQEVTLTLKLRDSYTIERMNLRAWFATSSSKDRLFQLGRIRLLASTDGFEQDSRTVVDFTDDEMHGNWGDPGHAPEEYEFDGLDAEADELRLVLTPRPGTAVYMAELMLWGSGEGLAELAAQSEGEVGYVFNSVIAADLDGDGIDETIGGNSNGKVYCLDADGSLRWTHDCDHEVNSVAAVDFDGDGTPSIVAGTMNSQVIAIDSAGERMWRFEVPYYKRTPHVRVVFPADLTGDGSEVVVAGADSWRYYAIDASGEEIWHYESVHGSTAGAAADLDADGRDEVICGTEYYWWHCVNPDGTRKWQVRTAGGPDANAVTTGDLDGDGRLEVIFGGADTTVQAYSSDGDRLWVVNTGDEVTDVICADVDGDGAHEVLASSMSFNVYCLDGDGTMIWRTGLPNQVGTLALLDRPDGRLVAAGCDDGAVYALRADDGTVVARQEIGRAILDLAAAKLGAAGGQDVIVAGAGGRARALRLP